MTAQQLADALAAWPPAIWTVPAEDPERGFLLHYRLAPGTPPELARRFRAVKTGVAAIALNRPWYADTRAGRPFELSPREPVPAGATILSVGGSARWDRLHWSDPLDCPELFGPTPCGPASPRKPGRRGRESSAEHSPVLGLEGGRL